MRNFVLWKTFSYFALITVIICLNPIVLIGDGGMYPVNQLDAQKLKNAGLKIPVNEIYNPDGVSMMQAVVSLGGCTGSFVSSDGLILTNHHCVFGSLAALSNVNNNIMDNGFVSAAKTEELPLKDMTVKIMLNYEDVSSKVLKDVNNQLNPIQKRELIASNIQSVLIEEKAKYPELSIELAEMLTGKSYLIIRYQFLKDIRLVYVPPREIGEFGGETDNWMWPRHSGDFSFIRAYVAPDGSPAAYSTSNIPFKPQKFIKINTSGVNENDFIFVLGYPGRTFRNRPSHFLNYSEKVQMPFIADFFEYRIAELTKLSKLSEENRLNFDPQIKSLANTSKNYRGKLKSLTAINLYQDKKSEENKIILLFKNHPEKATEFKEILAQYDNLYQEFNIVGQKNLWYSQLFNVSPNFDIARLIVSFYVAWQNSAGNQNTLQKQYDRVLQQIEKQLSYTPDITDSLFVKKLLLMAFQNNIDFPWLKSYFGESNSKLSIYNYIFASYKTLFKDLNKIKAILDKPSKIATSKNPFIQLVYAMINDIQATSQQFNSLTSSIDALLPRYVELKMEASGNDFIPDANSTFRFTYGYIRGYSPADAVYYSPFTTLKGIPEKVALGGDYQPYQPLIEVIDNTRVQTATQQESNSFKVNFLYNADTTGGNSGSPVLNANGELVGLNFDRAFEACVNDFAWNESYSRSIGVDIRYIIFILKEVKKSNNLLSEIGAI